MEGLGVIGDDAAGGCLNATKDLKDLGIRVVVAATDARLYMKIGLPIKILANVEICDRIPLRGKQQPGGLLPWQQTTQRLARLGQRTHVLEKIGLHDA
jgi:hypothetical protein